MTEQEKIEKLACEVHKVYCKAYSKRFGKAYFTKGDYSKLDEGTKNYDRAFVRWHLSKIQPLVEVAKLVISRTNPLAVKFLEKALKDLEAK